MNAPHPWIPDRGDGTYANPILHADYSDPDVIRVGNDFWMTASSFNCAPGLPILHSTDLVNWSLVNHAIRRVPHPSYSAVRAGCGVWAPSIRFHAGKFWIFFPMPDEGIFVTTAEDPLGDWVEPWCLQEAKGWIDPCPFWDDDGTAWLAHAYAMSRSGLKERIHLRPMSPDGRRLLGDAHELFHTPHHLYLEGPKVHKFGDWYYILCPGGGVQTGWQVAFRSRRLLGPYEEKVVLEQGSTEINGPHQGALVDAPDGSWWFVHFQDRGPYGRITHLQPVLWQEGWPLMGVDYDGNRVGEPVRSWRKPVEGNGIRVPATSDDFDSQTLGLQWQWNANPLSAWYSLDARKGWLRLWGAEGIAAHLTTYPRFLGQKFPASSFLAETLCDVSAAVPGSIAGMAVVGGGESHGVGLRRTPSGCEIVLITPNGVARLKASHSLAACFRVQVNSKARFSFFLVEESGSTFPLGPEFQAKEGGWIGARIGLFHCAHGPESWADFSYLHFRAPDQ